ncbi:hypothetical protein I546_4205 [Mycobacterium kansasii 732]|nr:hypothetical protein I546_4205 [Mycobacterium kansasii 732]
MAATASRKGPVRVRSRAPLLLVAALRMVVGAGHKIRR